MGVCLGLVCLVALIYGQVATFDFLNFDDDVYVGDNTPVMGGLTVDSIRWAFVDFGNKSHGGNWHPLTWLSMMLDVEIHGGKPGGFHIINVLFHTANTLLLLWFLCRTTGALWPSAIVAALFAVHPLNVESVAWIAERKGMLSTTFFMLAILVYSGYARHGGVARYLLVMLLFALGLMAKPVLVTLPFVLLLLDYWPLERLRLEVDSSPVTGSRLAADSKRLLRLFLEKVPLLIMTATSCTVTFLSERDGGSMTSLEALSIWERLGNSFTAYLVYLQKIFWPVDLAIPYPLEKESISAWIAIPAILFLASVTAGVIWKRVAHPWACVGWMWFLGILVPVIKFVHVGREAYSDKFTYLPSIGIFIAVAFTLHALLKTSPARRAILNIGAVIVIGVLSTMTWIQTGYWKDSITLFTHTLAVTENNYTAHANRGLAFQTAGDHAKALEDYSQALKLTPDFSRVAVNRGIVHRELGQLENARDDFSYAIYLVLSDRDSLGGKLSNVYYQRGKVNRQLGDLEKALRDFDEAIRLVPKHAKAHLERAGVYVERGEYDLSLRDLKSSIDHSPQNPQSHNELAWLLATCPEDSIRNGNQAVQHARKACELSKWADYSILDTLSTAYAESGDFENAIQIQRKAIELAPKGARAALQSRLKLYRAGQPYRAR